MQFVNRRSFIATTAAVSVPSLAGCGGFSTNEQSAAGSTVTTKAGDETAISTDSASLGTFRLLISDRPAAIGEFDSLDVTFDTARVFRAGADEDAGGSESETETETETGTETETTTATETETEEAESGERGFETFDLDGATVDLTQVVGDRAVGVLEAALEAGTYTKVELHVASVDGVVGGEAVDVTVPSNKLLLTKPFEVAADTALDFVFDINVVKKGPNGYNLLPVISESGVAGSDVEVEEIEADESSAAADGSTDATESETETTTSADA